MSGLVTLIRRHASQESKPRRLCFGDASVFDQAL